MAEERQILLELEVDKKGAQKALQENEEQLKANQQSLQILNNSYKQGNVTVEAYAKRKLQLKRENKELTSENRQLIKTLDTEENSLNALRASLAKLTKERNNTNQATKEGQERFAELQEKILETTTAIKAQEQAGGDFRRNVGNYGDALRSNIPLLDGYVMKLQGFKEGLIATQQGLGATTKGLGGTAKALKVFRLALVSTGIGAIVVALGSLITFLTSTQRGIDAVTKVTRPLQQIFQRLIGVVQDLGGEAFDFLADAIQNPIQALKDLGQLIVDNIINRFKALQVFGEAISELFKGNFSASAKLAADATVQLSTGITNATDRLKSAGEAVIEFGNDAIEAGTKIDELTKAIEREDIALIKLEGTNNRIIEQNRELAEDQSRQTIDRIENAKRALDAVTELENARIAQFDRRIELLKLEQDANDTSREDLKELAELERQREEAAAQAAGRRTSINNLLNTLLKQEKKERQELFDIQRIQNNQELEGVQKVQREIQKVNLETTRKKIANIEREIEAERLKNEIALSGAGQLAGAVSQLFDENTAAFKAAASIEAAIATYQAINKALAFGPGPPATIPSAIAVGIQGFANVAKINGLFKGGGGASSSATTTSQPRITRTSLSGSFDRNQLTGNLNQQQAQTDALTQTVRNMPAPIVKVSDINKTQKRGQQVIVNSGL